MSVVNFKKSIIEMTACELILEYKKTMLNIEQSYMHRNEILKENERRIKLVSEKLSED